MSPESRSPGTNGSNLEEVCTGYASGRAAVIALRASRRRRADSNAKRNGTVLVVVRGRGRVREQGHTARRSVVSTHPQRQSPLQNRHRTCTNSPEYVPLWVPRAPEPPIAVYISWTRRPHLANRCGNWDSMVENRRPQNTHYLAKPQWPNSPGS